MAQIKPLKIAASGLPTEVDVAADEVTFLSYTVNGGGPVLDSNLDMNNGNISGANDLAFTDPTTDGITTTSGTHPADKIMFEDEENVMDVESSILFPVVTDDVDELDAFRLPAIAGVPTAAPADGGEGYLVWDSTNDHLYAWNGASWDNLSTVDSANTVCNPYTAAAIIADAQALYISAADSVDLANAGADATAKLMGFANGGAAAAAQVDVCSEGVLDGFTGMTAGDRMFLDTTDGAITSSAPSGSGNNVMQAGFAKSATELHIHIQYLGKKAV